MVLPLVFLQYYWTIVCVIWVVQLEFLLVDRNEIGLIVHIVQRIEALLLYHSQLF